MIYLASPYTGDRDRSKAKERAKLATQAAAVLIKERREPVIAIVTMTDPLADLLDNHFDHDFWLDGFDLPILRLCNRLVVLCLPGWATSKGVGIETAEAERLGIPIEFVSPIYQDGQIVAVKIITTTEEDL